MSLQSLHFYHVAQGSLPVVSYRLYPWCLGDTGDIFLAKFIPDNIQRASGVCFFLMRLCQIWLSLEYLLVCFRKIAPNGIMGRTYSFTWFFSECYRCVIGIKPPACTPASKGTSPFIKRLLQPRVDIV